MICANYGNMIFSVLFLFIYGAKCQTCVSTLAGNLQGSSDGVGTVASFTYPSNVVVDSSAGVVYVADYIGNLIRAITVSTKTVTTLAGDSTFGHSNGVGTSANFRYPSSVAIDATAGVVYVTDKDNHMIRAITVSTEAVSILAGSPIGGGLGQGSSNGIGTSASFCGPFGVTFDSTAGVLYVADSSNNQIRAITVSTKAVSTLAGSTTAGSSDGIGTSASFSIPTGVSIDSTAGIVYVADKSNNMIRAITVSTGAVSTLAGSATAGSSNGVGTSASFNGPWGVLVYPAAGVVYVADRDNHMIRAITVSTATVTTLAGSTAGGSSNGIGTSASFAYPTGLAVDSATGALYVADTNNHLIRAMSSCSPTVSSSGSRSPSLTPSITRSRSASSSPSRSRSTTALYTGTTLSSHSLIPTRSVSSSASPSPTVSFSTSHTITASHTTTLSRTPSSSYSISTTISSSRSPSVSPSISSTPCSSSTHSPTISTSVTPTATHTAAARPVWPMFRGGADRCGATSVRSLPRNVGIRWKRGERAADTGGGDSGWERLTVKIASGAGAPLMGALVGSPVIGRSGRIFAGSNDGNLYSFLPNGTQQWAFRTNGYVTASPAVDPDSGTVYVGDRGGVVRALNDYTGGVYWTVAACAVGPNTTTVGGAYPNANISGGGPWGVISSPAVGRDGTVYVACVDGRVGALSPGSGAAQWWWSSPTPGGFVSSPALRSEAEGEILYIGSLSGEVFSLWARSGILRWVYPSGYPITSTPAAPEVSLNSSEGGWVGGTVFLNTLRGGTSALWSGNGTLRWSSPNRSPLLPAVALPLSLAPLTSSPAFSKNCSAVFVGGGMGTCMPYTP